MKHVYNLPVGENPIHQTAESNLLQNAQKLFQHCLDFLFLQHITICATKRTC